MFRVIFNRLKAKAEELLEEEQAGFRPGWSTVEQLFISLVTVEKYLQHQRDMFHSFLDCLAYRPVAGPQTLQHR